jgi:hypothetical protein
MDSSKDAPKKTSPVASEKKELPTDGKPVKDLAVSQKKGRRTIYFLIFLFLAALIGAGLIYHQKKTLSYPIAVTFATCPDKWGWSCDLDTIKAMYTVVGTTDNFSALVGQQVLVRKEGLPDLPFKVLKVQAQPNTLSPSDYPDLADFAYEANIVTDINVMENAVGQKYNSGHLVFERPLSMILTAAFHSLTFKHWSDPTV